MSGFVVEAWVVIVLVVALAVLLVFFIRQKVRERAKELGDLKDRIDALQGDWIAHHTGMCDAELGEWSVYDELGAGDLDGAVQKGRDFRIATETVAGKLDKLEKNFYWQVPLRAADEVLCKKAAAVIAKEPALMAAINAAKAKADAEAAKPT